MDGNTDGTFEGFVLGILVGENVGTVEGAPLGILLGLFEDDAEG